MFVCSFLMRDVQVFRVCGNIYVNIWDWLYFYLGVLFLCWREVKGMRLTRVKIENFKSLRSVDVPLEKVNVVVGQNASGKTNFVDAFLFLREVYTTYVHRPFIPPYLKWWGWKNIVHGGRLDEPIRFVLFFYDDLTGLNYTFETVLIYEANTIKIHYEKLQVNEGGNDSNLITIEREGDIFSLRYGERYLSIMQRELDVMKKKLVKTLYVGKLYDNLIGVLKEGKIEEKVDLKSLLEATSWAIVWDESPSDMMVVQLNFNGKTVFFWDMILEDLLIKMGRKPGEIEKSFNSFVPYVLDRIQQFFQDITVLKVMDVKGVREPKPLSEERTLNEDYSNLVQVLYNIYLKRHDFPDEIKFLIKRLFPNTFVSFKLLGDGRISLVLVENGLELDPPSISDGVLKVLGIATALYNIRGGMLLIDQIEDSLHAFTIETILDELREKENLTVIVTTHSPVVIDITDPKELIIATKEGNVTTLRKIESPSKVKEELSKLGVTLSERWLYGEL